VCLYRSDASSHCIYLFIVIAQPITFWQKYLFSINMIAMIVFILEITLPYRLSYLYNNSSMFLPHPKEHMAPPKIEVCANVIPDFVRNLFFHIRHSGLDTEFKYVILEPEMILKPVQNIIQDDTPHIVILRNAAPKNLFVYKMTRFFTSFRMTIGFASA